MQNVEGVISIFTIINIILALLVFSGLYTFFNILKLFRYFGVFKNDVTINKFKVFLNKTWVYRDNLDNTPLNREKKFIFNIVWNMVIPFCLIIGFIKNPSQNGYIWVLIASFILKKVIVVTYKNKNEMVFNKNAYRIYKFLHNQIVAGVHVNVAVVSLYKVVSDKFLKERLQAFGSMYASTLNFDIAFKELSDYYTNSDVDTFRIAMLQGIDMGDNINTLKKQEQIMFSKYMGYLQLETERQKLKTFIVVSIYCAIIIVMIGLPLLIEIQRAMGMIFLE